MSEPITKEQLESQQHKVYLKTLVNGSYGSGKTYYAMTHPKWAYAMIEPHGITTALSNKHLLENMVYYESFVPSNDEDIKVTFERLLAFLKRCREDAKKGLIETVIVDNLTHLSENRWLYIDRHEKVLTTSGNTDTRAMFGNLSRWLYRFTILDLLSIPANIVLTCHELEEQEEDARTGKLVKTGDVISNTLGGFRNEVAGLFNASLFLECKKVSEGKYQYRARCLPGQGKAAKNNLNLPEHVEDISYAKLMAAMKKELPSNAGK